MLFIKRQSTEYVEAQYVTRLLVGWRHGPADSQTAQDALRRTYKLVKIKCRDHGSLVILGHVSFYC